MKLREIFRYELRYRLRSGATWAYAGILLFMGFWMFLATADGAEWANAPERIAGGGLIIGMFGLMVTAALFADAALRDVEAGMDPLVYTSSVSRREYVTGRFLGALVVNAIVALAVPLAILLATWFASTGAETVGHVHPWAYVEPVFTFLLPNLVFTGALLFTIALLTRQAVPVYVTALAIFIGTIVLLNYSQGIESQWLLTLLDPLGVATLMKVTRLWTEAERNTRLVGLPAALLVNRVVWLSAAAGVLALLSSRFRFGHPDGGARRGRARRDDPAAAAPAGRSWPVSVPRVEGVFGLRTTLRQTLAIARASLADVMSSRWFVVLLLLVGFLTVMWGWNVGSTVFDTSTWPVTLLIVEEVIASRSAPLLPLLIALYAGELVWKQRDSGTGPIADAAPVSEGASLFGRFLALVALIVAFQAMVMLGGLLIQALQGYYHFEPGLYLRVVFGIKLADYLVLAALAMLVHVVVNQKYLGHMLTVAAFVLPRAVAAMGGMRHNLLLYGRDPGWTYSDMNGFGPYAEPFAWFKAYWSAWAVLLLVVAVLFWVRGQEHGMRRRLRVARERFAGPIARTAGVAAALVLLLGGFVFYNTNVLNDYVSPNEQGAEQAEYERRYRRFEGIPQPTITHVELRAEIYPDRPAVDLRGSYRLVNQTDGAIDSVHVMLDPDLEVRALSLDRAARAVVEDVLGYRIFELERPLQPGEATRLEFDIGFRQRGFPNEGLQTDVVGNGTSFNRRVMPFVGYQPLFELPDGGLRARHGLPPQEPTPGADDLAARQYRWGPRDADLVHVDVVIGTAPDQIAITSGALQRSWTERGRAYFQYRTETPIAFGGTTFSARYAVREDRWHDVAVRVFHHPRHGAYLDNIVHGAKAALDYLTVEFGPYPYGELNIVERPRYGGFGSAHPLMIAFTEDVFFSRVREGEVDQPFYGAAHEVAHTWWGGLVRGGAVRGAGFLSESLANYSAMLITEKAFGPEAGRAVYDFQMERYLSGRAQQSNEVPVLEVEDQPYLAYRKGAVALMTLRDLIGEEAVNGALRRYFERFRDAGPPYPTSLDLYAELQAVTPDSLQTLLVDLFETVTLWDIETERAVVERMSNGRYAVTLHVVARKLRADDDGDETEAPLDQMIEVGLFAPVDGGDDQRDPIYTGLHRIRSGRQTIRLVVDREPALAGIDPRGRLIERYREDNVVPVEIRGAGSSQ